MPFVAIAGACQVNVKGTLLGEDYENVWYSECSTTPDLTELNGIAAVYQTGYVGILNPLSADLFVSEIEVRYLGAITGPSTQLFITPAMNGGNSTQSMPGNVAFCMRLSTALSGRQYRGRKYFGGIPTTAVTGNGIDLTFAGNLAAACEDLRADLVTNGTPMAVVSKTHGTVAPVTSIGFFDLNVDSQRRRLAGRGR